MPIFVSPEKMLAFSNVLLIVAAVLTVIATFLVVYYGNVVGSKKQTELKAYQTGADSLIVAAHNRADASDREVKTLRRQMNNRILSPEQLLTIRDTLLGFTVRQVQVSCVPDNEEAYSYAKQLSRALESAHWRTGAGTMRSSKYMVGAFDVSIVYREEDHTAAMELAGALTKAGVKLIMSESTLPLKGFVQLYAGMKG